jgi:hypothetical protein
MTPMADTPNPRRSAAWLCSFIGAGLLALSLLFLESMLAKQALPPAGTPATRTFAMSRGDAIAALLKHPSENDRRWLTGCALANLAGIVFLWFGMRWFISSRRGKSFAVTGCTDGQLA